MNTLKKIRKESRKKWRHNEETGFLHVSISDEKMKACLQQQPEPHTPHLTHRRPIVAAICVLSLVLVMACTPLGSYAYQFLFPSVSTQEPTEKSEQHYGIEQGSDIVYLSENVQAGIVIRDYQYKNFHVRLTEDHNDIDSSVQIQDAVNGNVFTADICNQQAQCYQDADGAMAFMHDTSLHCTLRVVVSGAIPQEDFLFILSQIRRV